MTLANSLKPVSVKGPFAVLDVGSSKLGCLIVEPVGDSLNILSHAMHVSAGVVRGEVTDLALFSETVGKVVEAAESKANLTIHDLHIVLPGGQSRAQIERFSLELTDPIISKRDIRRLGAKQMQMPIQDGHTLIASQKLHYIIDGQSLVQNPRGMRAKRLAVDTTAMTIATASYHNLGEACQHNHLRLGRVGHAAFASGLACLSPEDADLGTLVLDMGGGTTSAALFVNNGIIGSASIPVGGLHITRDIARILSVTITDAERLKAVEGAITPSHGEALIEGLSPPPFSTHGDNFIPKTNSYQIQDLMLPNGVTTDRGLLRDIIRPRVEEILDLIHQKLVDAGLENHIGQRVVLTGGASQLTGMADFVSQYWKRHATVAVPKNIIGLDEHSQTPAFSALIGMALHVIRSADDDSTDLNPAIISKTPFGRLGMWFRNHL